MNIESHPFPPFIPDQPRVLFLGTFPPQPKRWKFEFYYPNWNNDFWRICGYIFYQDKHHFCLEEEKDFRLSAIKEFLTEHHMAVYDTAMEVVRLKDNASDKFLDIRKTIDLYGFLQQYPSLQTIVTTGEKAASVIAEITHTSLPAMGTCVTFEYNQQTIFHYRMPSTSRAYPMALEKKAEKYRIVFEHLRQLP